MPLIVEDGSAVTGADAYVSRDAVAAYATANGHLWVPESGDLADAAVRRATRWVDGRYRSRFPGWKRDGRAQRLEWPRRDALVYEPGSTGWGYSALPDNEVPREIVEATCEAAIRELAAPGTLSPDIDEGTSIQSVQAGSVSVTFAGGGLTERRLFESIDLLLGSLLAQTNQYSGLTGRC